MFAYDTIQKPNAAQPMMFWLHELENIINAGINTNPNSTLNGLTYYINSSPNEYARASHQNDQFLGRIVEHVA